MQKDIRSSTSPKALGSLLAVPSLTEAMEEVRLSVDRFCLLAGVEALIEMMEEDAEAHCGARHRRHADRRGYRWGRTVSETGFHGGKVIGHISMTTRIFLTAGVALGRSNEDSASRNL